jgi:hypothetical protein
VIDLAVEDEEDDEEEDMTVVSAPVGLKPSFMTENDGEDSESEAACIVS